MQQRRAFTRSELITGFKAITNWNREECELLVDLFIGFEHDGYVLDNGLTTDERGEFYYLEKHNILETKKDMVTLNGKRNWYIFQWTLNYELLNQKLRETKGAIANVEDEIELATLYNNAFNSYHREKAERQRA